MTFVYILFYLAFTFYHVVFFGFSAHIFSSNNKAKIEGLVCGIVNGLFWTYYSLYASDSYEFIVATAFLALLFIEYKIIFKIKWLFALFISLAFAINIFAKRMVFFAIAALVEGVSFVEASKSSDINFIIMALCFFMSISTISTSRHLLKRVHLDTILSDNKNMVFLTSILCTVYVTIIFVVVSTTDIVSSISLLYYYIVVGTTGLFAFAIAIVYAYQLAELRMTIESYQQISTQNSQEKELIKVLEEEAITDQLTGLNTRELGEDYIKKYTDEKSKFFIAFIDIDNLKYANDNFGHDEGDLYIKAVAQIVKDQFPRSYVCRFGGDEIVVVGKYTIEESVSMKVVKCFNNAQNIKALYGTEFNTSISYGLVFVPETNKLTGKELIAIADERMFEMKKLNNKQRKAPLPKMTK